MTEQTNQNEQLFETPFENAVTLIAKNTVLHAIEKGDLKTVKSYVETGFQVNADLGVATPLSVATAHNQAEIADFAQIRKEADAVDTVPEPYYSPAGAFLFKN